MALKPLCPLMLNYSLKLRTIRMKRTLADMWAPQVSATGSPPRPSSLLPSPSPSATFAEHALVARDLMEDVSVQFIEGGVVQAQLDADSLSSSDDDEGSPGSPLAPSDVLPSPSFCAFIIKNTYFYNLAGSDSSPSGELSAKGARFSAPARAT